MRKVLAVVLLVSLAGCRHGEIRKVSYRQQVLQTQGGAAKVQECEDIPSEASAQSLKAEGWTLDECYKAFL